MNTHLESTLRVSSPRVLAHRGGVSFVGRDSTATQSDERKPKPAATDKPGEE